MTLADRLTLLFVPIRVAGRAALIDTAVLSLTAVLVLTGGGFWLAAGFVMALHAFGIEGALMLSGLALWVLAVLVLLVRAAFGRTRRQAVVVVPVQDALADPLPQLVFDLCVMAGRAFPRRKG